MATGSQFPNERPMGWPSDKNCRCGRPRRELHYLTHRNVRSVALWCDRCDGTAELIIPERFFRGK